MRGIARAPAGSQGANSARVPICASARSARVRITRRSSITWASRPSNLGFGGEGGGGGVYHSIYDDFYWYTHFADTDFVYGRALAQTAGTAVIRLADAELLPFQFGDFADTVRTYIDELKKLDADQRAQIEERNREIDEGVFTAAADPRKHVRSAVRRTRCLRI